MAMTDCIIYHNPRCSKSRQTLALLEANGVNPRIIDYIKTPLTEAELTELLKKLSLTCAEFIRKKEAIYKELALKDKSEKVLLKAMLTHPKLIERPVVVKGDNAVIGRPPEDVLALL